MTSTQRSRPTADPRTPVLARPVAMRLAATEYERFLEALRRLADADWSRPTDCPDWDVRAMATHVLGMAEMSASLRSNVRQNWTARRRGGSFIDALTGLQVEERRHLAPAEVVARFAAAAPKAARGRRRTPGFVRRRALPIPQAVDGALERWSFGFLVDVVLTRDTWMHRVDLARATGKELHLTPDHDGVLVADVVAEWAERHGQPCTLHLRGPAGGDVVLGSGGPALEADAVEFCRVLSGRGRAEGLLAVAVPF